MISHSAEQTKQFGFEIGSKLKPGAVVALVGELGSGKTTFVKGLVKAFGVKEDKVSSPTFVLIHEYEGRNKIFHIDWYRLEKISENDAMAAEECFAPDTVTLIEWADKGKNILPDKHLRIEFSYKDEKSRIIKVIDENSSV